MAVSSFPPDRLHAASVSCHLAPCLLIPPQPHPSFLMEPKGMRASLLTFASAPLRPHFYLGTCLSSCDCYQERPLHMSVALSGHPQPNNCSAPYCLLPLEHPSPPPAQSMSQLNTLTFPGRGGHVKEIQNLEVHEINYWSRETRPAVLFPLTTL